MTRVTARDATLVRCLAFVLAVADHEGPQRTAADAGAQAGLWHKVRHTPVAPNQATEAAAKPATVSVFLSLAPCHPRRSGRCAALLPPSCESRSRACSHPRPRPFIRGRASRDERRRSYRRAVGLRRRVEAQQSGATARAARSLASLFANLGGCDKRFHSSIRR